MLKKKVNAQASWDKVRKLKIWKEIEDIKEEPKENFRTKNTITKLK